MSKEGSGGEKETLERRLSVCLRIGGGGERKLVFLSGGVSWGSGLCFPSKKIDKGELSYTKENDIQNFGS